MKNIFWLALTLLFFVGCKSKKKSIDDQKIEITDFINFFDEAQLPLNISDSVFAQKNADTISNKAFMQFVPDSVLTGLFHKTKPLLSAIAKVTVKNGETYLFTKATTSSKKVVYIIVFNQSHAFKTAMPLIVADNDKTTSASANMDLRYTLTLLSQQSKSNQEALYKKDVYIYNSEGIFTLILTDANGTNKPAEIINPIDTFPAKHKFSGDYVQDKKNFVSFRDGRKQGSLLMFVHFEKDNAACKGELKGEAKIISDKLVKFTEAESPCGIDFTLSGNKLTMKEVGGCGSYRDIKCFFEGSFTKKQVPKKQKKKK